MATCASCPGRPDFCEIGANKGAFGSLKHQRGHHHAYLLSNEQPASGGRTVALTVVADGDIGVAEIEWLDRLAVHEQLGLARHELHALLDTFCEDLLSSDQLKWADVCPVDERTLADLMGEIQDPAHRLKLLRLCVELAEVRYGDIDAMTPDGRNQLPCGSPGSDHSIRCKPNGRPRRWVGPP
jgi:hypothetical protein